ncbi:MAG: class I SAM-dependent methyltransferase [Phycisphaeraceae bacterium]|nr:class I SAM-dependent methyltransferase [Phycisphaeraceae bacterium]
MGHPSLTIHVAADPPTDALVARARSLAERLGLSWADDASPATEDLSLYVLAVTGHGLELRQPAARRTRPLRIDWRRDIDTRSPAGRSTRQPLAKAVGLGRRGEAALRTLDLTAGLGEDAYVLACLGATVTAVERNPVLAALLLEAHERWAAEDPETAARLRFIHADSLRVLQDPSSVGGPFEVIYLDPMFPADARHGAERRPLQVVRSLVGDDPDAAALLPWAQRIARRRVVVKRPHRAPPLGDAPPSHTIDGKAVRWDVYMIHPSIAKEDEP